MSVVYVKAMSARFHRYRGIVLAILGVAIGVSFGVTPLVAKPILDAFGWRAVFIAFALPPLVLSLPLALAWFRDDADMARPAASQIVDASGLGAVVRTMTFWTVVLFSACSAFVFIGLQAHVVAFLQERGLSAQLAVETLSIAVFGTLVCQLVVGWLLDALATPRVALIFVAAQLSGVVLLFATSGVAGTVGGILLLNAGAGSEMSMLPYLLSRIFGVRHLARIYGLAALIGQLVGGAAPVVLGAIHDRTGTYAPALPVFATILIVGGILVLRMPRFAKAATAPILATQT